MATECSLEISAIEFTGYNVDEIAKFIHPLPDLKYLAAVPLICLVPTPDGIAPMCARNYLLRVGHTLHVLYHDGECWRFRMPRVGDWFNS